MKNYLAAFVGGSAPLHVASYSKETHFYLNDDQQCYIAIDVQRCIFDQYSLYQSPSFRAALRYLPDYDRQIERVYTTMHKDPHIRKKIGQGCSYIHQEYNALIQSKREKEARAELAEKERAQHLERLANSHQLASEFKRQETHLYAVHKDYVSLAKTVENASYAERLGARAQAVYEALKQPVYTSKHYTLTQAQESLLIDYGIQSSQYTHLLGNQLQQYIHGELITLIDYSIKRIDRPSEHEWLGYFINAIHVANCCARCVEPLGVLDFAWSAVDALSLCNPATFESEYLTAVCAAAVHLAKVDKCIVDLCKQGEIEPFILGAWSGISSLASLIRHPIDSFTQMVYHLATIIRRLDEVPNTLFTGHIDQAHKKAISLVDDFVQFQIDAARAFVETPENEVIAKATATAFETIVLHACAKAVCSIAHQAVNAITSSEHAQQIAHRAHTLVKNVERSRLETCNEALMTAEGIEIAEIRAGTQVAVGGSEPLGSIPKYISKTIDYILADEAAISNLAEKYKTFKLAQYTQELGFESVQITERYLKHIFGIEIEEVVKRSGLVKKRLSGFHHDYLENLERNGRISVTKNELNNKFISKKDLLFEGKIYEAKTFFPKQWTYEECIENIAESLRTIDSAPKLDKGRWVVEARTHDGIKIVHVIEQNGKLVTSYPIF